MDDLIRLFSKPEVGRWAMMIVSTGLAFYAIAAGRQFATIYVLFMLAAQVNATFKPRPAIAFSVLVSAGFLLVLYLAGASSAEINSTAIGLLIGMTFVVTLSQVLLRYSEQTDRANSLLEQLKQANAELIAARQKEKELTIAEERLRMARDLHDGLGHHLTALSIQLQAAEKMTGSRPEMAAEALRNARGEVQAALKEVRLSVAALRETPVDITNLPQTIAGLVEDCGKRSGLRAVFEQTGAPIGLTSATAMTIYRATQEGLTNVQRHAEGAGQVWVRLAYDADFVELSVEDDGQGQPDCSPDGNGASGGFGLAGLRERANLLGGQMECSPRPGGGFRIALRLPVKGSLP
jgi:signal transduction histidine kinase